MKKFGKMQENVEEEALNAEEEFTVEEWDNVSSRFELCILYCSVIVCALACGWLVHGSSETLSLLTILFFIIESIICICLGITGGNQIGLDSPYTFTAIFFLMTAIVSIFVRLFF